MNQGSQIDKYRQNAILGTRPEQMVPLLYEHLTVALRRADEEIARGDIEAKCEFVQKASDILHELMASLDFEQGGELAPRLASLYSYFIRELGEVGRTLDRDRLAEIVEMVDTLRDSWSEAARQVVVDGSPGGDEGRA